MLLQCVQTVLHRDLSAQDLENIIMYVNQLSGPSMRNQPTDNNIEKAAILKIYHDMFRLKPCQNLFSSLPFYESSFLLSPLSILVDTLSLCRLSYQPRHQNKRS